MVSPSPVKKRLSSLITGLAVSAVLVQDAVEGSSVDLTNLAPLLDGCSEDYLAIEKLLSPAYASSPSGVRYSPSQCEATAQITADMIAAPMAMLVDSLMEFLMKGNGLSDRPQHVNRSIITISTSKLINLSIISIMTRVMLVLHFTLEHIGTSRRPSYVRLMHTYKLFPHCFLTLSYSTLDFRTLSPTSSAFFTDQQDRLNALLCAAVFSCTLGEYCHAAYGDVRWSSDVTEEMINQDGGVTDIRPTKKEVWAQMRETTGTEILSQLTQLLTTAAQIGTFFPLQSPLYQSLLTPSMGVEMMVRAEQQQACFAWSV